MRGRLMRMRLMRVGLRMRMGMRVRISLCSIGVLAMALLTLSRRIVHAASSRIVTLGGVRVVGQDRSRQTHRSRQGKGR